MKVVKRLKHNNAGIKADLNENGESGASDLVRQLIDRLPSIVQHVSHTEYGAERVLLAMVVALPNLLSCHRGGKIPPETETFEFRIRKEPTVRLGGRSSCGAGG